MRRSSLEVGGALGAGLCYVIAWVTGWWFLLVILGAAFAYRLAIRKPRPEVWRLALVLALYVAMWALWAGYH